ncbi:MAG: nitroreductase [Caulobacteraceae bacterium]|nr:nitroreductase [Caulobacteraceae bacterium]
MPTDVPAPPEFGKPAPYGQVSPQTLALLARRRSSSPQHLAAPAPSGQELQDLLRLAARVPDHGKLFPWRFIILQGQAKAELAARFEALARERPDPDKAAAVLFKLKTPPLAVLVISRVSDGPIPAWEQLLSAGAVCQTLLIAATAIGYGANWITDWYSYDPRATALLGLESNEQVAGVVLLGTPTEAPLERIRPDVDAITSYWTP